MKEHWDYKYSASEYIYGKNPNEYFKYILDTLEPGKLLLPSEGEGRNAVYAAKKGWSVTAVDFSIKAKEKALKLAEENNVKINYVISHVEKFIFPEKKYDAVALIYAHYPPDLRTLIHSSVVKSLKPGGTLILEAFNKKQINNNTGGPKDLSLLYNTKILNNDFHYMITKELNELEIELGEGKHHEGKADIIRLFSVKNDVV
ncbi:MAG: class I SAM-dependent methyltransferase [Ignavibacteria bacterium]|nr:class I SAM-dependent methyltransferase [Ignavibacteria bacterium]